MVLLAAAVIAVPIFKRLGLSSVLGYLAAGIAVGPSGFRIFTDPAEILHTAELGVVFLLFVIGLELKPSLLWSMRRDIFGLGTLQVVVTGAVLTAASLAGFGFDLSAALIAGFGLALSSTAYGVQTLEERAELNTGYGKRAFSILLMQDLAIVPLLTLVSVLAPFGEPRNLTTGLVSAAAGGAALLAIVVAGRYFINPLFRTLAHARAREIMTAAALLVVIGAAWLMEGVGFSMALGAFLAGVLLAESSFRHELEADIEPFRGLLLGLFFLAIGMSIDLAVIVRNWTTIAGAVVALLAVKTVLLYGLTRAFGASHNEAVRVAVLLPQGGEFGFVLFSTAAAAQVMRLADTTMLAAIVAISMALTPVVGLFSKRLLKTPRREELKEDFAGARGTVFIVGFGRFGQIVSQVLLARGIDVTIIDNDPARLKAAARFGFHIYYGDGVRLDVLRAAGAAKAEVIAVCTARRSADRIVSIVRSEFPLAKLYVRSEDRMHSLELRRKDVTYEQRETLESALAFGREALVELGVDNSEADEVVDSVRRLDAERLVLQETDGIHAGNDLVFAKRVVPHPLTKPHRESQALSEETRAVASDDKAE
nr:monovalent cation:proton antiporter-2 (CPA2) family protein [Rhodobium orientis]